MRPPERKDVAEFRFLQVYTSFAGDIDLDGTEAASVGAGSGNPPSELQVQAGGTAGALVVTLATTGATVTVPMAANSFRTLRGYFAGITAAGTSNIANVLASWQ